MRRLTIALLSFVTGSVAISEVAAQVGDAKPAFDVVSIRPHNPNDHTGGWSNRGGRQTIIATTPLVLIMSAFNLHEYEVIGAPDWSGHEQLDVLTTTDEAAKKDIGAMMQSMLEDRFALK